MDKPGLQEGLILSPQSFERLLQKMDELSNKLNILLSNQPAKETLDGIELCKLLKITPRTLQRYRDRRLIEFNQVGSKIIYSSEAVKAFMEANRIKPVHP